jgi:uncharacterized protein
LRQYDIIWKALYTTSVEHVRFTYHPDESKHADGCIVGIEEGTPFRIGYEVKLDSQWAVQEVFVTDLLQSKPVVHLLSNGEGQWRNKEGTHLAELNGCIDIDFTLTPFTNTLPIHRLQWEEGATYQIQVVYITHPTFEIYPAKQTYTCLFINDENMRFHFKMNNFEREITVNREGFVIDYPELFENVWLTEN